MPPHPRFPAERLPGASSLTDRVTEALTRYIAGGEVGPRSRLPSELEMADRFGVSRTVVREAVARLKYAGLVESRQGSGLYVREPNARMQFRIDPGANGASARSVLEIVELRRGIEAEAAALAAERRTRGALGAIHAALRAIAREEAAGRDGVEADMEFHRAIVRASGNRHFPALWDFVGQFLRGAMGATRANEARRADFATQVHAEHHALADAIARRDPAGARAAAVRHMEMAAARIRAADPAFWRGEAARYTKALRHRAAGAAAAGPEARRRRAPGRSSAPPRRSAR